MIHGDKQRHGQQDNNAANFPFHNSTIHRLYSVKDDHYVHTNIIKRRSATSHEGDAQQSRSSCSALLSGIPRLCGPTDNEHCFSSRQSQSQCRDTLIRLKATPDLQQSCICPSNTNTQSQNMAARSCQDFYNLVYNHPCLYHPGMMGNQMSRNQWNFDLEFANQLLLQRHVLLSCPSALHACRKSPLCRRVYDEFRRRCKVKDDRCRMTNAALCYNSYELIKLTPLWKCMCDDSPARPEQRCLRIQKSIVGNACISRSFPWLPAEETTPSGRVTSRPAVAPRPRPTSRPRPPPTRPTAAPTSGIGRPSAPIEVAPAIVHPEDEDQLPPLPDEHDTTEETATADSQSKPEDEAPVEPFPGPDEDYVFFPRIALFLLQPIIETIRNILVEQNFMTPLPPPPTTTTVAPVEEGSGDVTDAFDTVDQTSLPLAGETTGEVAEGDMAVTGDQAPLVTSTILSAIRLQSSTTTVRSGAGLLTTSGRARWRVTTAVPVTGSVTTDSNGRKPATTHPFSSRRTFATATTRSLVTTTKWLNGRLPTTTTTIASLIDEDGQIPPLPTDTTEEDQPPTETETTTESTTTTQEEEVITYTPDPRGLHSSMCWQQIEEWRTFPQFNDALLQYHNSCRWHTPSNESCDAMDCVVNEMRVKRWMGDYYQFCRNLTCEGNTHCEALTSFLTPGCINVAPYLLEDVESDVLSCRDVRRNVVLRLRRGQYGRVFTSETCSQLCTCENGKMTCPITLPCIESKECQGEYASYPPGSPAYRAFQGQCVCYTSRLLCLRPFNYTTEKGAAYLFMAYSAAEEQLMNPITNASFTNGQLVRHFRRLPYPHRATESCLFHQEPTSSDYIILKSDQFEFVVPNDTTPATTTATTTTTITSDLNDTTTPTTEISNGGNGNRNGNGKAANVSAGTRANEEACDKYFKWIANQINDRSGIVRQNLLLSLIKLAESEREPRPVVSSGCSRRLHVPDIWWMLTHQCFSWLLTLLLPFFAFILR